MPRLKRLDTVHVFVQVADVGGEEIEAIAMREVNDCSMPMVAFTTEQLAMLKAEAPAHLRVITFTRRLD